ncbi:MAG: BamA/TamA family outer membrane protein [Calothrix sp. CSU_2_0]|nr:BamA/TamA family outer membrane protein [Calothrix sp. CSU_2_0]
MRLSPVLMTVVAIAAPLGSALSANAQTSQKSLQNTEKTTEVATEVTVANTSANKSSTSNTTQNSDQEYEVVAVFPAVSTLQTKPASVKTAQNNPEPNSFPGSPSDTPTPVLPQNPSDIQETPAPTFQPNNQPTNQTPTQLPNTRQQVPLLQRTPQTKPQPNGQQKTPTQPQPNTKPVPLPPPVNAPAGEQQTPVPSPQPNNQPGIPNPNFNQPNAAPEATEPRVLVSEVVITPQSGKLAAELEQEAYRVIRTQAGRTTTRSQLQEDINAIFATGFFSNVQASPEDTPLGVRVTFVVQPNPVLTKVQIEANPGANIPSVLPATAVDEIFKEQYGRILNLRELQENIKRLTKSYQDKGFVLANVIGAPKVSENGVVTLQVAEGVVENVRVRFRSKEGQDTDEKGQPIRGRTQNYIVTRELELKPGGVFNRNIVQRDLQRVAGLGLFEDVNVSLDPGTDPSKVDVVVNVVERNSGSIAAGAGISSASGLFGTISYQQQNLGGRSQKLGAELQVGQRELLFDVRFTDPWIAGDPYRTSYTVNAFRRQSISLIFDGKDENIETFNPSEPNEDGDRPRVTRTGGGITFTRPLSRNPFKASEWIASAGLQYQRVSTLDSDRDVRKVGRVDRNDPNTEVELSQSGEGRDDLLFLQLGASRDRRNNPLQPTSGSLLRFGVDQSVPVGLGNIFLTRLRGSYSYYIPVKFTNFTKGKGAQALAFNVQAGTILGDLPPYEAFTLGGSSSVRGYEDGSLSSGRSYVQATVEYRFPVFSVVSGALFFDFGSDLGTTTRPAEVLNKNGTGYGYGLGVRVQSPLGPIRIDYGISDEGDSRINFGIGERF